MNLENKTEEQLLALINETARDARTKYAEAKELYRLRDEVQLAFLNRTRPEETEIALYERTQNNLTVNQIKQVREYANRKAKPDEWLELVETLIASKKR